MAPTPDFYPPGISIVCAGTGASTADLEGFLAAHAPSVEQVCLSVRAPADLEVARAAGPKVRAVVCPEGDASEQAAWETAGALAQHTWSLFMYPEERLDPESIADLRTALPSVVGAMVITIGGQPRIWRSGFARVPDGKGGTRALQSNSIAPRSVIAAESLPTPVHTAFSALGTAPRGQAGPVLITGMHRSGTSTIARVINLLGVALGDRLEGVDTAAHPSNPKGHWEDLDARALNVSLLQMAHAQPLAGEWIVDATLPAPNPDAPHVMAAKKHVARLAAMAKGGAPWGFKDPRTCLTLDVWHAAAPDARVVLCVRDPLSAATSLHAVHGVPVRDGLRLWRAYNERALESCASRGIPVLVCSFSQLLEASIEEAERLADFLGLRSALDAQARTTIDGFLERELRHHEPPQVLADALRAAFGPWAVEGEVDGIVALYEALQSAAGRPVATLAAVG